MKSPLYLILGLIMAVNPFELCGQYIINGSAIKESCNCYVLTPDQVNQSGSVWQSTKINLHEPFDFIFDVYPGCRDLDGADGIVFILQPSNTSIGNAGEGLGYQGISPSIGISLDTYQNLDEPAMDHMSIQANGDINHNNDLAGPVPASAISGNIEDCQWHKLRVNWQPSTNTISIYFDGVFRLSAQINLVADIFNNDPMVYWGFSGSTGGTHNIQKFCTPLVPSSISNFAGDATCLGTPVVLTDKSTSYTTVNSFFWDFGDGTTSTEKDPPPHVYASAGVYPVKHSITGMDGCESAPFIRTVTIGDKPQIALNISDTCEGAAPRIDVSATVQQGNINYWSWVVDGNAPINSPSIDLTGINAGKHSVQLNTASTIGCKSDTVSEMFTIKNSPKVNFETDNGCIFENVNFTAMQTDANTRIIDWLWDFGNNTFDSKKETQAIFKAPGNYIVELQATANNGCITSFKQNVFINEATADAGKDTVVLPDSFFQLSASGGLVYSWSPATGLNDTEIANPTGSISDDITYHLTVQTAEGCFDTSSVHVKVFKGSAVYVPNAFTPNNDRLNDELKPFLKGIKTLYLFSIYDRWGNKLFSTHNINTGWNGTWKGQQMPPGAYVWVLKAEDLIGKIYDLNGSFILIK